MIILRQGLVRNKASFFLTESFLWLFNGHFKSEQKNSDVSVLVQVGAECLDLTFPVHKHLALRLLRAQGPPSTVHSAALHERSGTDTDGCLHSRLHWGRGPNELRA